MKISTKRALALLIDSFIFGIAVAILQLFFPDMLKGKGLLLILLFIPFFCRDIVFANASLGKRLLGICIYDSEWKRPSFIKLILRSFGTATVGFALMWKSKFADGNTLSAIDWEFNKFGTRVIDKKVFKELEEVAKTQNGDFAKNMTELYSLYLRDMYLKQK